MLGRRSHRARSCPPRGGGGAQGRLDTPAGDPADVAAETLQHPEEERTGFLIGVVVVSAYAVDDADLGLQAPGDASIRHRQGRRRDIGRDQRYSWSSGGGFSEARLTLLSRAGRRGVPLPAGTDGAVGTVTVVAYVLQAVAASGAPAPAGGPLHRRPVGLPDLARARGGAACPLCSSSGRVGSRSSRSGGAG